MIVIPEIKIPKVFLEKYSMKFISERFKIVRYNHWTDVEWDENKRLWAQENIDQLRKFEGRAKAEVEIRPVDYLDITRKIARGDYDGRID